MKKAIFLFDYTGIMARPWADAGYLCYCFDGQHPEGVSKSGHENILNVGMWFNPGDKLKQAVEILKITGTASFVFGFPECTDLTVAGAKHFDKKKAANELFQLEAIELCDLVRVVGILSECPWAFENPIGVLSTQYRKYDFKFNPCDYAGYLNLNNEHPIYPDIYPDRDLYNKATCIWSGNKFKMPGKKRIEPLEKDNPGWKKCGGKSLKTKNIRSATPRGFAQAVFEANQEK